MKTKNPILIQELSDGSYRLLTKEETVKAKKANKELLALEATLLKTKMALQKLRDNCKHDYCYDTEGMPYNVRHCMVCGHSSLL